jgi:hypothetical protein
MKVTQTLDVLDTNGTSLQGYMTTTRRELTETFGEPLSYGEGDKVTIEWCLRFEDGTIATIYDWKRYEAGEPAMDEIFEYNIGGNNSNAVNAVAKKMKTPAIKVSVR